MNNRGGTMKKMLSKNLLEMRFMQRTREKAELDFENEEPNAIFGHQISHAMRSQGGRFLNEPSYMVVESLMFGHRAYNGMNSEIEKMTATEEAHLFDEASGAKAEAEISDHEMAQQFSARVNSTVAKKFTPKRHLSSRPSKGDMLPLMQQGVKLLQHSKSMSKAWTKEGSHKKKNFLKPSEENNI